MLRKDRFDDREMDFYEALYTQSQAQFGAYVETGTLLNNYAHIFDLLIRLRQVSAPSGRPPLLSHQIRSCPCTSDARRDAFRSSNCTLFLASVSMCCASQRSQS